jgi:hypothetical protein
MKRADAPIAMESIEGSRVCSIQTLGAPVQDVGTDAREYQYFAPDWKGRHRRADGRLHPLRVPAARQERRAVSVLATAARGSCSTSFL